MLIFLRKRSYIQRKGNTLYRTKQFLIGFGFFWLFSWSILGSILGARIQQLALTKLDTTWVSSWEFTLLKTAHTHMNLMGITTILIALSIPHIRTFVSDKFLLKILVTNLLSIPIFGLGLILEAFTPPVYGSIPWATGITAIGAIFYLLSIGTWASLFIASAFVKRT